ncbi:hypothetical protein Dda_2138 [Drechslerella dactyloides]|uniref:LysM domain-containing protein n=1 Tax=Drechslerella dactyloides TaxID=74499 RepID=A0AAD6NM22_DREDA|nr:hypothetical protein Dda_2138 [Drechslerella dactyloides]
MEEISRRAIGVSHGHVPGPREVISSHKADRIYTIINAPPPPSTACATCSRLLQDIRAEDATINEKSEKADGGGYYSSSCCARVVCASCAEQMILSKNALISSPPGPFCPIKRPLISSSSKATAITSAPPLRDSPSPPPPYTASETPTSASSAHILHYLSPNDTLASLSLLYDVPLATLRAYNRLYSDTLLPGRPYLLIPRTHYTGPSLSPSPIQPPESSTVTRFQVATKCVEYDIARVYLAAADWDLDAAVERYIADEAWERANSNSHASSSGGSSSRSGVGIVGGSKNGIVGSAGLRRGFFR